MRLDALTLGHSAEHQVDLIVNINTFLTACKENGWKVLKRQASLDRVACCRHWLIETGPKHCGSVYRRNAMGTKDNGNRASGGCQAGNHRQKRLQSDPDLCKDTARIVSHVLDPRYAKEKTCPGFLLSLYLHS